MHQTLFYPAGHMIEHYRIMRFLGRGGMGEVYLARDTKLGRKVAIKLIDPERMNTPSSRVRFHQEALATASCSHPHIIAIFATGEHHNRPYVVLEYLEGEDLKQRLQRERCHWKEAARIALAVTQALVEAHGQALLHRDLKPGNIFLPTDGRIRVLDFGLAIAQRSQPPTTQSTEPPREAIASLEALVSKTETGDPSKNWAPFKPASPESVEEGADDTPGADDSEDRGAQGLPSTPDASSPALVPKLAGTPAYIAPELWRAGGPSASSDMWSVGVVLYECLFGVRPFQTDDGRFDISALFSDDAAPLPAKSGELPSELIAALHGCLNKDPTQRPPATQLEARLQALLHKSQPALDHRPFVGLQPFDEIQAGLFFGRSSEINALVEQMRTMPTQLLVGPSGAGKSSLIRAGVLPRVREGQGWLMYVVRPGKAPFRALADAVCDKEVDDPIALAQEWFSHTQAFGMYLRDKAMREQVRILLCIDQGEELLTQSDATQRGPWINALLSVADEPQDPTRVIFAIRDDCLGGLGLIIERQDWWKCIKTIAPLTPTALQEIIDRPLALSGYKLESEFLRDDIITGVTQSAAGLPLLQFTMQALWDQRSHEERTLTVAAYEAMGGVAGALATHADGVMAALPTAQASFARAMFLRLVTFDGLRRRQTKQELLAQLPQAEEVLQHCIDARLIVSHKGKEGDVWLELAHEALCTHWHQMARWLRESRKGQQELDILEHAATVWAQRGQADEALLGENELRDSDKLEGLELSIPPLVTEFLEASSLRQEQRNKRKQRSLALGFCLLFVVAIAATLVAIALSGAKAREQDQKQAALAALGQAYYEEAKSYLEAGKLLFARARIRRALELQDTTKARLLWQKMHNKHRLWHRGFPTQLDGVVGDPGGRYLAAFGHRHGLSLMDGMTYQLQAHVIPPGEGLSTAAFSQDGTWLGVGDRKGRLWLYHIRLQVLFRHARHKSSATALLFHPTKPIWFTAGADGIVREWSLPSRVCMSRASAKKGRVQRPLSWACGFPFRRQFLPPTLQATTNKIHALAFVPNTSRLLLLRSQSLELRQWPGYTLMRTRSVPKRTKVMAFHPKRQVVVTADGAQVQVWQLPTLAPIRRLTTRHTKGIESMTLCGPFLLTGSKDRTIQSTNLSNGRFLQRFVGHEVNVTGLHCHDRSDWFTSAGWDGSLRGWALRSRDQVSKWPGLAAPGNSVAFHPKGEWLATGSWSRTVALWNRANRRRIRRFSQHRSAVTCVSFHPDGAQLASADRQGNVFLQNVATGHIIKAFRASAKGLLSLAFSPDGKQLATAGADGVIRLWNSLSGQQEGELRGHKGTVWAIAYHPQGHQLASVGQDESVRVWAVPGRSTAASVSVMMRRTYRPYIGALAFDHTGRYIAVSSHRKKLFVWDLKHNKTRSLGPLKGRVLSLAFHPHKPKELWTASGGALHRWQLTQKNPRPELLYKQSKEINSIAFDRTGRFIAATGDECLVQVWSTATMLPLYRMPLLHKDTLFHHTGAHQISQAFTDNDSRTRPTKRWQAQVLQRAISAQVSAHDTHVCILDANRCLTWWSLPKDKELGQVCSEPILQIRAHPQGCVYLTKKGVFLAYKEKRLHKRGRLLRAAQGVERADTIDVDKESVFIGTKSTLIVFATPTAAPQTIVTRVQPTTVRRYKEGLLIGAIDGSVFHWQAGITTQRLLATRLLDTVNPVSRIVFATRDVLFVAHEGGQLFVWSLRTKKVLDEYRLSGSIQHLQIHNNEVLAATSQGNFLRISLAVLEYKRCHLLRILWRQIPLELEGNKLFRKPALSQHPCAAHKVR